MISLAMMIAGSECLSIKIILISTYNNEKTFKNKAKFVQVIEFKAKSTVSATLE